jgi:putative ABC transport system ATP-binding protein
MAAGPDTTPSLLQLFDIRKVYQTRDVETHALCGVHLEVRRGEFVAIEGPSGSGKTTLLSILGLLDAPSSGDYVLAGRSIRGASEGERARIRNRTLGFIFQHFNLISELTVWANVELPLQYRRMRSEERTERVAAALERVDMLHRRDLLPSQLSGGQQQRVAVARAVAGAPEILLADEPTGSLDSTNGRAVMDLIDELHDGGTTICIVTHNHDYARRARRTVRLFDGRVVDDVAGPP